MKSRLSLLIALAALLLSACNFSLAADVTPPPGYIPPSPIPTLGPLFPAAAADIANGQSIYVEKCLPCHGETGLGDGPQGKQLPVPVAALGLAQTARPAAPARWFTVVSQGNIDRFMPPFSGSLSEQERWDVISYALSLHLTADSLAQGKELFEANCSGCSTAAFKNQEKMASLSEDDLAKLVREGGEGLKAFPSSLSDDQVYAVAGYLRSLSFAAAPVEQASTAAPTAEVATGTGTPAAEVIPSSGTPGAETTPEAASPAGGVVNGVVTNKSGAPLPSGTKITLRGYDHADSSGPKETLTLDGTLSADGNYQFENVEFLDGRLFLAELEYQGITYQTQFKALAAGEQQVTLDPITVYESTDDFSNLSMDQMHIAFDFGTGENLTVFEIFSFTNSTDKAITIKTDGTQIPFIALPEGAQDVGFEAGQDTAPYSSTADGFALLPNDTPYSLIAFFTLPYNSKGTEITQPILTQTDSASVFAPEGIKVKSSSLTDSGVQNISGSNFHMYSANALSRGSDLTFTLSGKPDATGTASTGTDNRQGLILGAGALGLALIGVGVWMYLRDRNAASDSEEEADEEDEFEDPESVMDAIIALDDLYRAKKIPEAAYQQRRTELKDLLRKLENKA